MRWMETNWMDGFALQMMQIPYFRLIFHCKLTPLNFQLVDFMLLLFFTLSIKFYINNFLSNSNPDNYFLVEFETPFQF